MLQFKQARKNVSIQINTSKTSRTHTCLAFMIRCSAHINSFHSSPSAIKRSVLSSSALLRSVWVQSVRVPAQSHRCRNSSWFSSLSLTHTHLRQINSWPLWCHPSPGQSERPEGWVHYVSAKQGSTLESQSDGPVDRRERQTAKRTHTHTRPTVAKCHCGTVCQGKSMPAPQIHFIRLHISYQTNPVPQLHTPCLKWRPLVPQKNSRFERKFRKKNCLKLIGGRLGRHPGLASDVFADADQRRPVRSSGKVGHGKRFAHYWQ